jgi:hypothetical protein
MPPKIERKSRLTLSHIAPPKTRIPVPAEAAATILLLRIAVTDSGEILNKRPASVYHKPSLSYYSIPVSPDDEDMMAAESFHHAAK